MPWALGALILGTAYVERQRAGKSAEWTGIRLLFKSTHEVGKAAARSSDGANFKTTPALISRHTAAPRSTVPLSDVVCHTTVLRPTMSGRGLVFRDEIAGLDDFVRYITILRSSTLAWVLDDLAILCYGHRDDFGRTSRVTLTTARAATLTVTGIAANTPQMLM